MENPAPGIVGRNLRCILAEEQIAAALLAEWVGVHTNSVQNWMRGRDPGATKLYKAAQVLRRPMEDFFKEEYGK